MSYLKNVLWGRKEQQFKEDYTLTLCGPDFSGKTTLFNTLSSIASLAKFKTRSPWVIDNSTVFRYMCRSFKVNDIAGDGLSHRTDGLDILRNCIDPQNGMVVFIHDSANGDVTTSTELLGLYAKETIKLGGRYLMIVLNKQETILPVTYRWPQLHKLKSSFEAYMSTNFSSQLCWKVFQSDNFHGKSKADSKFLLDECMTMIRHFRSFRPQKRASEVVKPIASISTAEEESFDSQLDSETFHRKLKDGSVVLKTHVDRLRATYLTVLDAVERGQGMLELVEELQAMEERRSLGDFQRHRTMVLFWLIMFREIIFKLSSAGSLPSREDSLQIAEAYKHNLGPDVWKTYYTETLMLDPKTALYFRLPDIKPLAPPPIPVTNWSQQVFNGGSPDLSTQNQSLFQIQRFAFTVVKSYLASSAPSSRWIIEQSLSILESSIMRLRSQILTVEPYSETHAYFWISYMHSILYLLPPHAPLGRPNDRPSYIGLNHEDTGVEDLAAINLVSEDTWKRYYSPKLWYSMEARVKTMQPDIRPMSGMDGIPQGRSLLRREKESATEVIKAELPSPAEVRLLRTLALKQLACIDIMSDESFTPFVHSHLLFIIFHQLIKASSLENLKLSTRQIYEDMSNIHDDLDIPPRPVVEAWVRLVWDSVLVFRAAEQTLVIKSNEGKERILEAFEKFLDLNIELVFPGLIKMKGHATSQPLEVVVSHSEKNADEMNEKDNLWKSEGALPNSPNTCSIIYPEVAVELDAMDEKDAEVESRTSYMSSSSDFLTITSKLSHEAESIMLTPDNMSIRSQATAQQDWEILSSSGDP